MERPERDLSFGEAVQLHVWRMGFETEQTSTGLRDALGRICDAIDAFSATITRARAEGYMRDRWRLCRR